MSVDPGEVLDALDDLDRFVMIPRAVMRLLGPRDAAVLCWLRHRCRHDEWVDVTIDGLADEMGLSADQTRRALAALRDQALVDSHEPDRFSRRRQYRVARRRDSATSTSAVGALDAAESPPPEAAESPPLLLQEDLDLLEIAPDAFEAFWGDYPRKVGKRDARTVFVATLKERPQPDIAAGLERWLTYWRANGDIVDGGFTSYVPHPATWLRGRRWEGETPMPQARQNGANARQRGAKPETITERSGESGLIDL